MYWTDWGEKQKIQQANMDGSNIVTLVATGLNKPMGITVDYAKNRSLITLLMGTKCDSDVMLDFYFLTSTNLPSVV